MPRLSRRAVLCATLAAVSPLAPLGVRGLARDMGWTSYANPRFGYALDVPRALFAARSDSRNGDGAAFVSPDGDLQLLAWGADAPGEGFDAQRLEAHAVATLGSVDVTLRRRGRRSITLSWRDPSDGAPQIRYRKLVLSGDGHRLGGFEAVYPVSRRGEVDPLLGRIARSLRPPRDRALRSGAGA